MLIRVDIDSQQVPTWFHGRLNTPVLKQVIVSGVLEEVYGLAPKGPVPQEVATNMTVHTAECITGYPKVGMYFMPDWEAPWDTHQAAHLQLHRLTRLAMHSFLSGDMTTGGAMEPFDTVMLETNLKTGHPVRGPRFSCVEWVTVTPASACG